MILLFTSLLPFLVALLDGFFHSFFGALIHKEIIQDNPRSKAGARAICLHRPGALAGGRRKLINSQRERRSSTGCVLTQVALCYVKQFVAAHGARVFVESELDRGSTFRFTIP